MPLIKLFSNVVSIQAFSIVGPLQGPSTRSTDCCTRTVMECRDAIVFVSYMHTFLLYVFVLKDNLKKCSKSVNNCLKAVIHKAIFKNYS